MKNPWYRNGLRFDCHRSGKCCSGPTGRVWFTPDELQAMSARLELLPFEFLQRYARRLGGRWSLVEVTGATGLDCVFLDRDQSGLSSCRIHEVRPAQCRTWPFWPENVISEACYIEKGQVCRGIRAGLNGVGKLYELEEIERHRLDTPQT
ncbi:MAG: YkgJ family cysteine cluster protein [Planctomycetota bacterium]